jgi:hypothetical protein
MISLAAAMLLYPDIQKKAQDELDSVIGRERLPTFDDRPRLPFINAMCKEVLRWRPVTPVGAFPQTNSHARCLNSISRYRLSLPGVPHAAMKDDVYEGFFIPKGESCFLSESPQRQPKLIFRRRSGDRKCMVGYILHSATLS